MILRRGSIRPMGETAAGNRDQAELPFEGLCIRSQILFDVYIGAAQPDVRAGFRF